MNNITSNLTSNVSEQSLCGHRLSLIVLFVALFTFISNGQNCQSSYDREDLYGEDLRIDRPFMCGTAMMEDERYRETKSREKKGFYDIDDLIFYGYPGYFKKKRQLYYGSHPDTFTLIPNGDVVSIQFVGNFIRDKNVVYSKGMALKDVDVASFQIFDNTPYAKDNNSVFYSTSRGANGSEGILKIEGANAEHFNSLCIESSNGDCYYYGVDDVHVYYSGVQILGADAASFRLEEGGYGYAHDNYFVYYNGKKLEGSSGRSFKAPCSYSPLRCSTFLSRESSTWRQAENSKQYGIRVSECDVHDGCIGCSLHEERHRVTKFYALKVRQR